MRKKNNTFWEWLRRQRPEGAALEFGNWIDAEMKKRKMRQVDLAKLARVSQGQVSRVVRGEDCFGAEFCLAMAWALNVSPAVVYRAANMWPKSDPEEEWEQNIDLMKSKLEDSEHKRMVEEMFEFFLEREERKREINVSAVSLPSPPTS